MAIYSGFSHEKWWFSIAMLVHQRVVQLPTQKMAAFPMSWARLESQPSTSDSIRSRVAVLDTTAQPMWKYGKCWFNAGLMAVNSGLMRLKHVKTIKFNLVPYFQTKPHSFCQVSFESPLKQRTCIDCTNLKCETFWRNSYMNFPCDSLRQAASKPVAGANPENNTS